MQQEGPLDSHTGDAFDFVVIGSGFGGSISAMRLAQKGYRVLILERGRRFADEDFARTNWNVWKYLWLPALRCFGIQQITLLNGVLVLHGSGVGGGSLVYANVLMEPPSALFESPAWSHLADWHSLLRPHYEMAKAMLGVTPNEHLWPADRALESIAADFGRGDAFRPTEVGVFFGSPGERVPDPYFGGAGPERVGCRQCGGCMVGCRYNAKNTLVKNYLHFAQGWGAVVRPEVLVTGIHPLPGGEADRARYAVAYRRSTGLLPGRSQSVRARNVVVSAGALGTVKLLLHCRDVIGSLPDLSERLGERVRTNSEALLGVTGRGRSTDYSEGIAITSLFQADPVTAVEPVRYPDGSSFMRLLASPLIDAGQSGLLRRLLKWLGAVLRHPVDYLDAKFFSRWARRSTILLVMQTEDNLMHVRLGRSPWTLFRRGLVATRQTARPVQAEVPIAHRVTRAFADRVDGIPQGAVNESLLNIPTTAHILGGVPIGRDASEGVVGLNFEAHGYPGLYVVDGSIMPANPGINPSLTIAALAEYAMSQLPAKPGARQHPSPLAVSALAASPR